MNVRSLPVRIAFTALFAPLGWAAGFYPCMHFLPEFTTTHPQIDPDLDGSGVFRVAICSGAAVMLMVSLVALTLPWIRRRKRSGRMVRIAFSSIVVVLGSLMFADLGFRLIFDLLFAAWLTYLLAFTLVRYGVVDGPSRRLPRRQRYESRGI